MPGVLDDQSNAVAFLQRRVGRREVATDLDRVDLEGQPSAVGHRLERVGAQVECRLVKLPRICEHFGARHLQLDVQSDFLAQRRREQVDQFAHQIAQLQRLALGDFPPAKGEHLPGQLARPHRSLSDLFTCFACQRIGVLAEPRRPPEDPHQQVVEVVGDVAGELPERLELARLGQLALEPSFLSHVAGDRRDSMKASPAIEEGDERGVETDPPRGQRQPMLVGQRGAGGEHPLVLGD